MMGGDSVNNREVGMDRRTLFVGDLAFSCEEPELVELFGQFGPLFSVEVMRSSKTGEQLLHGFVEFEQHEDAVAALKALQLFKFNGRRLRLGWGNKSATLPLIDRGQAAWTQVHISFFTPLVMNPINEELLDMIFNQFGEVTDVVIKRLHILNDEKYCKQRGYGFVFFANRQAALQAVQSMQRITLDGLRFDCSLSKRSSSLTSSELSGETSKESTSFDGNDEIIPVERLRVKGPLELLSERNGGVPATMRALGRPPRSPRGYAPQQQALSLPPNAVIAPALPTNPQQVMMMVGHGSGNSSPPHGAYHSHHMVGGGYHIAVPPVPPQQQMSYQQHRYPPQQHQLQQQQQQQQQYPMIFIPPIAGGSMNGGSPFEAAAYHYQDGESPQASLQGSSPPMFENQMIVPPMLALPQQQQYVQQMQQRQNPYLLHQQQQQQQMMYYQQPQLQARPMLPFLQRPEYGPSPMEYHNNINTYQQAQPLQQQQPMMMYQQQQQPQSYHHPAPAPRANYQQQQQQQQHYGNR